ncbi:hypothetical protein V6U90_17820 [Micromonospora sp. CPCC 206060]|uniref:hypothetical protein n=1 Tax=Micromonospora sp. CPCC 206060 TaxID=3122406 RepID=UPI002FEF21C2
MRRAVSSVTVAFGLACVFTAGPAALAAPTPGPTGQGGVPAAGKKRCGITDSKLRELSGLVGTKTGYVVINDGTDVPSRKRIFFLDSKCKITRAVEYSGNGPFDTEDLALSADGGTLWIADIGDNITSTERRARVALWSMPVSGAKKPALHRLAYPERKPHDAEALLMADDNTPVIITKTIGKAEIFVPAAALKTNNEDPVPMKKAGEVTLPKTTTENVMQGPGRVAITGAARSPDGKRVVLRTYADAFEYDVPDGDIVKALSSGKPRVTPLADPFGEAIAYTPDGKTFLTVSDGGQLGEDDPIDILAYTPSTSGVADRPGGAPPKKAVASRSWLDELTIKDIEYMIAAVGVIGAILVGFGIFGIVRARRRATAGGPAAGRSGRAAGRDGYDPDEPGYGPGERGHGADDRYSDRPPGGRGDERPPGRGARGGVYGGAAPAGAGGVYGGGGRAPAPPRPPAAGRPKGGGGVYGGGRPEDGPQRGGPRGGVYGGGGSGYAGGRSGHGGRQQPDEPAGWGGAEPRRGRRSGYDGEPGGRYGEPRHYRGDRDNGYDQR